MTKRLTAAAIAAVALWTVATPAPAIVGGTVDGAAHPYVGGVDARPLGGPNPIASGVLISPTVFLTTAHFARNFERAGITQARVTFDPVASDASTWHTGTIHTNPDFDPSVKSVSNSREGGDLAVIVFDTPVSGVTPAALPPEDALGRQGNDWNGASFDVAGYGARDFTGGANGGGGRTVDFGSTGTRMTAKQSFASLSPGWLRLRMEDGAEICRGDSGAPTLVAGSNVVVGITALAWSGAGGQCESGPWDQRVDTAAARAFLGQFVALR